ncbi:MAG: hypothetical protein ABSG94_05810 [Brevinematales bacterium]|jgi:flavodoxin
MKSTRTLIYYYSWSGKTKAAAQALGKLTGAELRRIEEVAIRRGIFSFLTALIQAIDGYISELRPYNPDMTGFDRIFIGTPVWSSGPPPALRALLSEASFKRKKIVIFTTHMLSGAPAAAIKKIEDAVGKAGGEVLGSFSIRTTKKNMANPVEAVKLAAVKFL